MTSAITVALAFWIFLFFCLPSAKAQNPEQGFLLPSLDSTAYPKYIALNIGFNYADETRFYDGLLSSINGLLLQAVPSVKGYFPLSQKVSLTGRIPFLLNLGLVKDPSLPDLYNFEFNAGLGDVSAGLWWQETYPGLAPLKLGIHIEVIAPTGSSRFDQADNGFIDFGNGFWALPLEVAVVQNLSKEWYLFGNLGFIPRFSRTLTVGSTARKLSPQPIYGFKGGAAYVVQGGFFKDVAIGIEYQHFAVGAITRVISDNTMLQEGALGIHRIGLKLSSVEHAAFASSSFIGIERFNRSNYFFVGVKWTGGFNIVGFNFDKKRAFSGNKF